MNATANAQSVGEIINRGRMSRFQMQAIALCCIVAVLDGFDTQCMGYLAPSMAGTLNISVKAFGPVFAAGLVGYLVAALMVGPVADRWGRKWPVVAATFTFAVFAIITPQAATLQGLLILRFLTGLGLGGAMPNIVALASEFAPRRLLAVVVGFLFCGMPLGALLGSLISSVIIPLWGWQSVFYVGGFLPLFLSFVLALRLPESVQFLALRRSNPQAISRIMAKISPELSDTSNIRFVTQAPERHRMPVKLLFNEGRGAGTILLWIPYFLNLLMLYFIVSWLPSLLFQSGMPASAGVTAIAMFSVGGILGSVAQGRMMNGWGTATVMIGEFALSTLFIASLAVLPVSFRLTLAVTLVLGFVAQGAQAGLNVLAASFYPTVIRSTGTGWALGVGRLGSITGPLVGGVMLAWQWNLQRIFTAGALVALCATIAIALRSRLPKTTASQEPELGGSVV